MANTSNNNHFRETFPFDRRLLPPLIIPYSNPELKPHTKIYVNICVRCAVLPRKKNLSAIKWWWRYVVTKCIQFFPFGRNVYKVSAIKLSICESVCTVSVCFAKNSLNEQSFPHSPALCAVISVFHTIPANEHTNTCTSTVCTHSHGTSRVQAQSFWLTAARPMQ